MIGERQQQKLYPYQRWMYWIVNCCRKICHRNHCYHHYYLSIGGNWITIWQGDWLCNWQHNEFMLNHWYARAPNFHRKLPANRHRYCAHPLNVHAVSILLLFQYNINIVFSCCEINSSNMAIECAHERVLAEKRVEYLNKTRMVCSFMSQHRLCRGKFPLGWLPTNQA